MSAFPTDLHFYGSANMPDGDGVTTGGAVDFTKKISFVDISPTGLVDYISSSSSDTAVTITVSGRDSTGVIQTETKTLNGTTIVNGAQNFECLMKAVAGGTTAVGDIAVISHTALISGHTAQAGSANKSGTTPALFKLQAGDGASVALGDIIRITGGTGVGQIREVTTVGSIYPVGSPSADVVAVNRDWGTIPDATSTYTVSQGMLFDLSPNQITQVRRPFYNASSDVPGDSTKTYYEKIFAVDNNTATALTGAAILKEVDPGSGTLQFALTNVLNDSGTVANRQTAPGSGITAFSSGSAPQSISVPSPGNLPPGNAPNSAGAQGVWLSLALTAGLAPFKGSFTLRQTGATT